MTKICSCLLLSISIYSAGLTQKTWRVQTTEFIFDSAGVPFRQCHASTIVELSPGKFMAAWFGGSREGAADVVIWTSTRDEHGWTQPEATADGIINDTLRYPCWNPVLFKDREGVLHLYYKVGPNPREWWGMVSRSDDLGRTWKKPVRLRDPFLGPIKNKPVQIGMNIILSPSSIETNNSWHAHMERSEDGGDNWEYIPLDTGSHFDVIQPCVLQYPDGRLQALCRSRQGYVMQAWSADSGKTWSELTPTTIVNPNSGIDAVTLMDGVQLIVYNPDQPGKEWFNGRGELRVAASGDGKEWKDIAILENGTTEEFSYPAIIQSQDGNIHITYTYDRKNIKYVVLRRS